MLNRVIRTAGLQVVVLLLFLPGKDSTAGPGATGVPDPCQSTATVATPGACYLACPWGSDSRLDDSGATITITVKDTNGLPMPGIPITDIWLAGCDPALLVSCAPQHFGASPDSTTNANGITTISQGLEAGVHDPNGLSVVVLGMQLMEADCATVLCLDIDIKSVDIDGSCCVDLVDLSLFALSYTSPPHPYEYEKDFNCDGVIDLIDFTLFSQHYLHC